MPRLETYRKSSSHTQEHFCLLIIIILPIRPFQTLTVSMLLCGSYGPE